MEGQKVYDFLNASDNIRLIFRPGQHHGFENIQVAYPARPRVQIGQLYFDVFDAAFARGQFRLEDFAPSLLHNFSWIEWADHTTIPTPPPTSSSLTDRVQCVVLDCACLDHPRWLLGDPVRLAWSPGGQYGLLDYVYIEQMLSEGTELLQEQDGVTRMAANFGQYVHGNLYYPSTANMTEEALPAIVWLHPLSYQVRTGLKSVACRLSGMA